MMRTYEQKCIITGNTIDVMQFNAVVEIILGFRRVLRTEGYISFADQIRDNLKKVGINVNDTKDGYTWSRNLLMYKEIDSRI